MVLLKIIYTNFIKITFKIFLLDNKELKIMEWVNWLKINYKLLKMIFLMLKFKDNQWNINKDTIILNLM